MGQSLQKIENFDIKTFQEDLIGWYIREKEICPGERTKIHTKYGYLK